MIYQDRIYGQVEIIEPVILALINSSSLQRLRKVDQAQAILSRFIPAQLLVALNIQLVFIFF